MIALLKVFKRTITKDEISSYVAGAYPYGIYENGELKYINEENLPIVFPNSGKIFVPNTYPFPQNECFKLCELVEATYFEDNNPKFAKYSLDKDYTNIELYEVIDLDITIENDKAYIADLLTNGISISIIPSNLVLFRTADDYLIGPVQLDFNEGKYICKNTELVAYYQQDINISIIFDHFKNQERLFCLEQPTAKNLIGWIDVANNQRVISDALKQLKNNEEFGDLSRRISGRLKAWYDSNKSQEPHLQERLERAIYLIENRTLDEETTSTFIKLFLELDASQQIINHKVQELFQADYDHFKTEHNRLLKEITAFQRQLEDLEKQIVVKEATLKLASNQFSTIQETMEQKIQDVQTNFTRVYAEQLALTGLPVTQTKVSSSSLKSMSKAYSKWQSVEGQALTDLNDLANLLTNNLSTFRGADEEGTLAATIFSAILLGEPLIIYGEYSLDLAKCIAKTISCNQMLTLIPELETFTLNDLQSQYESFTSVNSVKSLIIHNPHTTAALYSLPTYLKEQKWHDDDLIPNLTIITLDSLIEATAFVEKLPYCPLIDASMYMTRAVHRQSFKSLTVGQLALQPLFNTINNENSFAVRRQFREWIEYTQDIEIEIPTAIVIWLHQINIFLDDEEKLFEWCYKIFKQSFKPSDETVVEVN